MKENTKNESRQSWFLPIMTLIGLAMVVASTYYVSNRNKSDKSVVTLTPPVVEQKMQKKAEKPVVKEVVTNTTSVVEVRIKSVLK